MKKFLTISMIFALFASLLFIPNVRANEDNRVLEADKLDGNNLYTAKFEGSNTYCTAVVLSPTVAITAKHCEGDSFKEGSIGSIYPAQSGTSTKAGKLPITTYIPYDEGYDIALLKGDSPTNDMKHYIKEGAKISKESNLNNYIGKDVYTIGYPQDKGENYQYRSYGTVKDIQAGKIISTDIYTSGGQSGSGLFLKENDELIGILSGQGRFFAIDSTIRDWINNKSQ